MRDFGIGLPNEQEEEDPFYKSSQDAFKQDVVPKRTPGIARETTPYSYLFGGGSGVAAPGAAPAKPSAPEETPYSYLFRSNAPAPQPKKDEGDARRGFSAALDQTPALLKGAVGAVGALGENVLGEGGLMTAIKKYGLEGYEKGMAEVSARAKDTDDITKAWDKAKGGDLGALVDWAQYGIGYLGGNIVETVATSLIGSAVGAATAGPAGAAGGAVGGAVGKEAVKGAAKGFIENLVAKEATKLAAGKEVTEEITKQATKNVAKNIGSTTALVGSGIVKETGGIFGEAVEEAGTDVLSGSDLARVFGSGFVAGITEGLVDRFAVKVGTGKLELPGSGRAGRAFVGAVGGVGLEGGTELIQTVIERYGAAKALTGEDAMNEYINAFALGALGGGTIGGLSGAIQSGKQTTDKGKELLDQAQQEMQSDDGRAELFAAMSADEKIAPLLEANGITSEKDPRFDAVVTRAVNAQKILLDLNIPTDEQREATAKERKKDVQKAFGETATTGVGVNMGAGTEGVIQRESVTPDPETKTLEGEAQPATLPGTKDAAVSPEDMVARQEGFVAENAFRIGTEPVANRFLSMGQAETFLFGPFDLKTQTRSGGFAESVPDMEFRIRQGKASKEAGGQTFFFVESKPKAPPAMPETGTVVPETGTPAAGAAQPTADAVQTEAAPTVAPTQQETKPKRKKKEAAPTAPVEPVTETVAPTAPVEGAAAPGGVAPESPATKAKRVSKARAAKAATQPSTAPAAPPVAPPSEPQTPSEPPVAPAPDAAAPVTEAGTTVPPVVTKPAPKKKAEKPAAKKAKETSKKKEAKPKKEPKSKKEPEGPAFTTADLEETKRLLAGMGLTEDAKPAEPTETPAEELKRRASERKAALTKEGKDKVDAVEQKLASMLDRANRVEEARIEGGGVVDPKDTSRPNLSKAVRGFVDAVSNMFGDKNVASVFVALVKDQRDLSSIYSEFEATGKVEGADTNFPARMDYSEATLGIPEAQLKDLERQIAELAEVNKLAKNQKAVQIYRDAIQRSVTKKLSGLVGKDKVQTVFDEIRSRVTFLREVSDWVQRNLERRNKRDRGNVVPGMEEAMPLGALDKTDQKLLRDPEIAEDWDARMKDWFGAPTPEDGPMWAELRRTDPVLALRFAVFFKARQPKTGFEQVLKSIENNRRREGDVRQLLDARDEATRREAEVNKAARIEKKLKSRDVLSKADKALLTERFGEKYLASFVDALFKYQTAPSKAPESLRPIIKKALDFLAEGNVPAEKADVQDWNSGVPAGALRLFNKRLSDLVQNSASLTEVLQLIARSSPNNRSREMAGFILRNGNPDATVAFINEEQALIAREAYQRKNGNPDDLAAYYDDVQQTINLLTPDNIEYFVLHEGTHAGTLRAIELGTPAGQELVALFEANKDKLGEAYGAKDAKEFIAEALSSQPFKEKLASLPAQDKKYKNLWEQIKAIIRRIFGFGETAEQKSLLDRVLELAPRVMQENAALMDPMPFEQLTAAATKQSGGVGPLFSTFSRFLGEENVPGSPEYGNKLRNPVTLKNGTRLTGFTDDAQTTFSGFDKGGNRVSVRVSSVKPGDIASSRDGNKTAGALTDALTQRFTVGKIDAATKQSAEAAKPAWTVEESGKKDNWIYLLVNKQIDLKRVMEGLEKAGKKISDQWNAYLQEELFHGRSAKRVKNYLELEMKPILRQMAANNVQIEELDDYLHARHAEEANRQVARINPELPDGGSGWKTADAKRHLASISPSRRAVLESIAKKVDAMTKGTREMMVEYGLESRDTINKWEATYKNYVPLFRAEVEDGSLGIGQGYSVRGSTTRRRVGSERDVVDVFANIAAQRERVIVRGEKNRVSNAMYGLVAQNPNKGFWVAINPNADDKQKLADELRRMGLDPDAVSEISKQPLKRVVDKATGMVVSRVNPMLPSQPNVLMTRVNGEDRMIIFNANDQRAMRMVASMKSLDANQLGQSLAAMGDAGGYINNALAAIGAGTRYFAAIQTQYNPAFGIYNFLRDLGGATLNLSSTPLRGQEKKVIANAIEAGLNIWKDLRLLRDGQQAQSEWGRLFEEFDLEGGKTGFRDLFVKMENKNKNIQKELDVMRGDTPAAAARAKAQYLADVLSDFNEAIENAIRLSAYKAAKEQGLSNQQAASIAKNLTVNFNRKGAASNSFSLLYAFFNASVQGSARLAETLNGPAGKKIIKGLALLGVSQAALLAMSGFDEDDPPDFVKDKNIIVPTGDGKYLAIPLPLGFNVIPALTRRMVELLTSDDPNVGKAVVGMFETVLDGFNPLGSATIAQTLSPTVTDPIIALAENKDFTGKPIARDDMNALDPTPGYTRGKQNATAVATALAEAINYVTGGTAAKQGAISPTPDQLEYLVGQATGGVGRELLKIAKVAESMVSGEELATYNIPVIGRLGGNLKERAIETSRYYDNVKKMNEHQREFEMLVKKGESGDYMQRNPEAVLYKASDSLYRQISTLKRQRRELAARDDIDQAVLKQLDDQVFVMMSTFNERVRQAKAQAQ